MKSYHVNNDAGLASLTIKEHERPTPGPREVLVRVRATSLNARDLMILHGTLPEPVRPEVIPGSDGAGEVIAIGPGVTRAAVGDRVTCSMMPYWIDGPLKWEYAPSLGSSLDGSLTQYALFPEEGIVHIPEHLSFEEAATLPVAGVTAWNALTWGSPLQAGQTVLTLGSGGVSLFALQFAKLFGARVIATTSSDEKAQRLKALGADAVINYRTTPDWHTAVRDLTAGQGVDRVIEVGGAGTLEQSIRSTAPEGQVSVIGWLANTTPTNPMSAIVGNFFTLRRIAVGSRAHFLAMNRAITANGLKPVIDHVFPFKDALVAYRYYEKGQNLGKVVINQS
jgi:NADPH:quinone reductase-like Zn-dependent oxidoreductase